MDMKMCATSDVAKEWDKIDWNKANAYVKKLQMRIVKAHQEGKHGRVKSLQWLLTHSFYARALAVKRVTENRGKRTAGVTEELSSVRKQLEKMEQEKADKTLKATVRKAVDSLEQQCQKMKQQLFEIKTEVKAKASEIVAEVKAKVKAALHKVSEFLGIKDKLESVRENVRKSIAETEHTINKLDAFGSGMREAGQKIANTFRTFADKETVDYSEKEKKFSKTELVKKPFEAKKRLYQRVEQHLDEALDKVNSLAKEPERMKDVEMAESSMLGAVAEPEFQYGADAFEEQYKELISQIMKEPGKDAVTKRKER